MSEEEAVAEEQEEAQPAEEPATEEPAAEASPEPAAPEPASKETVREPEKERDPLSRPRVIPLDTLLAPIPGESPSGEYLRYHGIYDEISEARRADEVLDLGAWQTELKVADFRKVIELAVPVLETQTKDLQIGAWLVEAIVAEHGFAGLRDGLRLLSSLVLEFWETVYPAAEDGDEEGRANALAWVDRETALLIRNAPLTIDGWGYNGYIDSKKFDIPANLDNLSSEDKEKFTALKEQAEKEGRATSAKWQAAIAHTNRAFCEEVNVAIIECLEEYKKLNAAIEAKFDRNQAPSLPGLKKSLDEVLTEQKSLLEMKRAEEPDPEDEEAEANSGDAGSGEKKGAAGVSGPIGSRADALKRLTEIASYFRKTEPHSPVSYLVNRAIQWGNMPLESWLQDVIKDQNILNQIKQTLGFNTASDGSAQPEGGGQPAAPPPEQPPQ